MGKFVRNINLNVAFDGDNWRVTLKPLTQADAIALLESIEAKDTGKIYAASSAMLPRYIVEATGGVDAAGQPVTAEDVCALAYFAPLVAQIVEGWLAQSMPGNSNPSGV
jgi:hypothetical protein